jgi:hypothetical protein
MDCSAGLPMHPHIPLQSTSVVVNFVTVVLLFISLLSGK